MNQHSRLNAFHCDGSVRGALRPSSTTKPLLTRSRRYDPYDGDISASRNPGNFSSRRRGGPNRTFACSACTQAPTMGETRSTPHTCRKNFMSELALASCGRMWTHRGGKLPFPSDRLVRRWARGFFVYGRPMVVPLIGTKTNIRNNPVPQESSPPFHCDFYLKVGGFLLEVTTKKTPASDEQAGTMVSLLMDKGHRLDSPAENFHLEARCRQLAEDKNLDIP